MCYCYCIEAKSQQGLSAKAMTSYCEFISGDKLIKVFFKQNMHYVSCNVAYMYEI